jgi:GH24 family phage-related lysozyme (muramidase)
MVSDNPETFVDLDGHNKDAPGADNSDSTQDNCPNQEACNKTAQQQAQQLSQQGLDFIKGYEKFSSTVYDASGKKHLGDWTIGWGHKTTEDAAPVTESQANAILAKDVQGAVNAVNHGLRVSVAQNQFDALVSLAFNAGPGSVAVYNQMMRAVNSGSVTEANFTAYRYSGHDKNGSPIVSQGLIRRREDEYGMYSEGKY